MQQQRSCGVIWSAVGLCAPLGLPLSTKCVRLSILTVCLLIPRLDILRCCWARDVLFSIALHDVRLKISMCWCNCRLACTFKLFYSFQSLPWGWVWMVLRTLMLLSILNCAARKLKQYRNLSEPFILFPDCDGSEVVNCNSVVVDRYIVSFDMTDRCMQRQHPQPGMQ